MELNSVRNELAAEQKKSSVARSNPEFLVSKNDITPLDDNTGSVNTPEPASRPAAQSKQPAPNLIKSNGPLPNSSKPYPLNIFESYHNAPSPVSSSYAIPGDAGDNGSAPSTPNSAGRAPPALNQANRPRQIS